MPFERPVKYLARVFARTAPLAPTAARLREVWDALDDENLLPVQATEATPAGTARRLAFQDGPGFQVLIGGDSIFIQALPPTLTFDAFLRRAVAVLERLLPLAEGGRASRLALVQEGSLGVDKPIDAARALLQLPPPFDQGDLPEWDWRALTRGVRNFGDHEEMCNTIATFKRGSGVFSTGEPFDGIVGEIDTNTIPENSETRFVGEDLRQFFTTAAGWHAEILSGIEAFLARKGPQ